MILDPKRQNIQVEILGGEGILLTIAPPPNQNAEITPLVIKGTSGNVSSR